MEFTQKAAGKTLTLAIKGPMTASNIDKQAGQITRAVMGGDFLSILINLDGVEKIDCVGMVFLVFLYKQAIAYATSCCLYK